MINVTKVYVNGQFSHNIYRKANGQFTTKSKNDIVAIQFTILMLGATLLGIAHAIFG